MSVLENNKLKVEIKNFGAELTSVFSKENNIEYLWQGNAEFWKRQSPVLFPFVGKLKDNTFFVEGKEYNQSQYGFARDSDFTIAEDVSNKITFELNSCDETLKIYPYKFKLQISYELEDNRLFVSYKVKNTDDKAIYFSIGAHPAFNCPLSNSDNFLDYYIDFQEEENATQLFLNTDNGLIQTDRKERGIFSQIPLDYQLFEEDALIFERIKSNSVSLKSRKHNHGISIAAQNWDYFAFWTKKDAPFICFEPWMGIADFESTNQNFIDKKGLKKLPKNEVYDVAFTITIF